MSKTVAEWFWLFATCAILAIRVPPLLRSRQERVQVTARERYKLLATLYGIGTVVIPVQYVFSDVPRTANYAFLPVLGWIGANVLRDFRLTIDYPHHIIWWDRQRDADAHDLDQVGLTLEARREGFFVSGIAQRDGQPTATGFHVGDRLVRIDSINVAEWDGFPALHRPDAGRRRLQPGTPPRPPG